MHKRGTAKIGEWKGSKLVSSLQILPITAETKNTLVKVGKIYEKIGTESHYLTFKGNMKRKRWWFWDSVRADGRIMTDHTSYTQFNPDYDEDDDNQTKDIVINTITQDSLWMTDPYIKGFSFTTKQWGKFPVNQISNIEFKDDAFDKLVLDPDKKELVRALVTNGGSGFTDIISGKGGGCIFLLHGSPGTGKTLTSEAIAEYLHRPLYSVSVGELGVSTDTLEQNLKMILEVAQIWNAVILIDEADIFLEKRSNGDILRNAMVGIFLRLLEYHQGVLFLTTNRVKEFDEAFHSRISVALKYNDLDANARYKIWTNLLDAAKITSIDDASIRDLSLIDINGRQIKNTIRLAQGLATQQNVPINVDHMKFTINITQQFKKDLT
jgi:hypothetical protein